MQAITDLEITYGSSLAPSGFRKLTQADGGQAELNRGFGDVPAFLWFAISPDKLPISELLILYDDEVGPVGFEKLNRNILKGFGSLYLWYRRKVNEKDQFISKLRIAYNRENLGICL